MNALVVYYSYTQNNEKVARMIRSKLNCDIARIEEFKQRSRLTIFLDTLLDRYPAIRTDVRNLQKYKHVIVVGPVWFSRIPGPIKTFLRREKDSIRAYSFVTVCNGDIGQDAKLRKHLISIAGKEPDEILELPISDLIPQTRRDMIPHGMSYVLDEDDLAAIEPKLNRFLMTKRFLLSYLAPVAN